MGEDTSPARADAKWDAPIPLDAPGRDLPPFPLWTLPQALQDLCCQAAGSVGCPVDYPASHALGVAAGAIGASFDVKVKRGFVAPSNLWVCVVASPGSGKSPAVAPILAPVYRHHAKSVRAAKARGDDDAAPAAKKAHEIYVSDITVESLAQLLADNPRGLLMAWDEMAGWITSFNQYKGGKGNDRTHYLSMWDGRAVKVNRKGKDNPPIFVRRPRLSVVGGIQPDVLDTLRTGPADGLFDRMLFVFPPDPGLAVETWAVVEEAPQAVWRKALAKLWAAEMYTPPPPDPDADADDFDPDDRPRKVSLSDAARPHWKEWTENLAARAAAKDAPVYFRAVAAKISGYAARLALVVHLVWEAYSDAVGDVPHGIGGGDMLAGIELGNYFLAHADRVHRTAGRNKALNGAHAVLDWAVRRGAEGPWTRSDVWESLRNNTLFAKPADLDDPLKVLQDHRSIGPVKGEPSGPGRPTTKYELNPAHKNGVAAEGKTV